MISWFINIRDILRSEPETWLSYLHGQQLHNRPHFVQEKPSYAGLGLQVAKFCATILRDFGLRKQTELNVPIKFFVFAGTANQMRSLDQTIEELVKKGEHLLSVGSARLLANEDHAKGYVPFQLTLTDIFRIFVLFTIRGWALYRVLKQKHAFSGDRHFSIFCSVYTYLAYFYRVLSRTSPGFVITANDHNVPNRCMLAVAHHLGIKTVYLQHASVSNIFPALRVNYAFLDGQCALDTYRECEPNQPDTLCNVSVPEIILSGQKKQLKRVEKSYANVVGVALNALDDSGSAIEFIQILADEGLNVHMRWHPGQTSRDTQAYRNAFGKSERITLSDPKLDTISDFMEQISWLIAGNSSIHLEAALAGVLPIYYELTPPGQPDYYGYVKHGLTEPADSVASVLELVNRTRLSHSPSEQAVRYYSSTYLTEWDGREGELVAESLVRLNAGHELPVASIGFFQNIE